MEKYRAQLQKPLEKAISRGHPWIYRAALKNFAAPPGAVVEVLDRRGRFLARGLAESGPIAVRVFTTKDQPLDEALLKRRLLQAMQRRDSLFGTQLAGQETNALRLVHGEADRLPGLVCDRYGPVAVLSFDGQAIVAWQEQLLELLKPELGSRGVTTLVMRQGRGQQKSATTLWGQLPTMPMEVLEHGMVLLCDLVQGQKTGLFLDHRNSRQRVRSLAKQRRVLNLFGYTGAFSVAAGLGGAVEVVTVDSAPAAIELAGKSWARNGLDPAQHLGVAQKVEPYLNSLGGKRFDLVIADPPSFAPKKSALDKALQAYRGLHRAALRRVSPSGFYLAASCSSHVDKSAFRDSILDSGRRAGKKITLVEQWGADRDHPILKGFPEGAYLKVVLCQVH